VSTRARWESGGPSLQDYKEIIYFKVEGEEMGEVVRGKKKSNAKE